MLWLCFSFKKWKLNFLVSYLIIYSVFRLRKWIRNVQIFAELQISEHIKTRIITAVTLFVESACQDFYLRIFKKFEEFSYLLLCIIGSVIGVISITHKLMSIIWTVETESDQGKVCHSAQAEKRIFASSFFSCTLTFNPSIYYYYHCYYL